jgi:hypothetical protein
LKGIRVYWWEWKKNAGWVAAGWQAMTKGRMGDKSTKGAFLTVTPNQYKTELKIYCPPYSYVSYLAMDRSTSRESGDLQLTDKV